MAARKRSRNRKHERNGGTRPVSAAQGQVGGAFSAAQGRAGRAAHAGQVDHRERADRAVSASPAAGSVLSAAGSPVFVFASDSLKGTLSSEHAAQLLMQEARTVFPQAECRCLTVADGGEGTAEAIAASTNAEVVDVRVQGPLVVSAPARFALVDADVLSRRTAASSTAGNAAVSATGAAHGKSQVMNAVHGKAHLKPDAAGKVAVLDVASASGLTLVPPEQRDPLQASSYGTGQLIRAALDAGARELYIGLGGSATVDGGMGMLAALGVRFWDAGNWTVPANGGNLADVASIDISGLDPRLAECTVHALSDVDNPLLGEQGAARVFGPQKGADPAAVEQLETGMASYAQAMQAAVGRDCASLPGAGAAGGIGFALAAVLHASIEPGADTVLDLIGFDRALAGADLCVTGEGRLDAQTLHGKAVASIAARCKAVGVPCTAVVGCRAADVNDAALEQAGIEHVEVCVADGTLWEQVQAGAEANYRAAASRLFDGYRARTERDNSD